MRKIIGIVLFALSSSIAFAQDDGLKIYISVDLEGITGTVSHAQTGPSGFEYQRFREFATAEALAAVNASFEAGATEVLVSDSHGNGQNLLIEQFPENVQVVRSWPRPLNMVQGIEEGGFDGVIYIGYHSSTDYMTGILAHTDSSASITSLKLNGKVAAESYFYAALAGEFDVPVIMISGGSSAVQEAQDAIGNGLEGAIVKWPYSFFSGKSLHPATARKLIAEKTKAAIGRIKEFKPLKLDGPVVMDISFKNYRVSEMLDYLPQFERTDSHSIRFVGENMLEISKMLTFIADYSISLSP